jgi:dihydrofolate reductase
MRKARTADCAELHICVTTAHAALMRTGSEICSMAKIVFGMNMSLDGYVDHDKFAPDTVLFRHFITGMQTMACGIYGRKIYQLMRYWDDDQPGWTQDEHDFATAWRSKPKWVVSRTLRSVGPNARLVQGDLGDFLRKLKEDTAGEIDAAGTDFAISLSALGLIDEYQLYIHPVVLGSGTPFFASPRPPLRLVGSDRTGEAVIRLTYVPA